MPVPNGRAAPSACGCVAPVPYSSITWLGSLLQGPVLAFRAQPGHQNNLPHLKVFNLVTSAESLHPVGEQIDKSLGSGRGRLGAVVQPTTTLIPEGQTQLLPGVLTGSQAGHRACWWEG